MRQQKIIDCDELMKHWNFEKNLSIGLDPHNLKISSTKNAFFLCEKGHEYTSQINTKTLKKTGCPICSNKIVKKGINDFASLHPDLLLLWDFKKNVVSPFKVSEGSHITAHWICNKGHCFQSRIYRMVISKKGLNCPYCRNQLVMPGFNDLKTTNPTLAKEWNYDKNGGIVPSNVIAGSPKKYWWKCSNGHEWQASLSSRNSENVGCPYCSGQKPIIGVNDLFTTKPFLRKLWNYEKNISLTPDKLMSYSNKKVWWKCKNGHDYFASIYHVSSGEDCPICQNKKVLVGFNDLSTTHPKIASEWNHEKNNQINIFRVTKGTNKKVWWKCEKGHEWNATITSRTRGNNCPFCSKETRVSMPEKTICYYLKKVFKNVEENIVVFENSKMEVDIFIPELSLGIEYDGEAWHQSLKNDVKKDKLCDDLGIKLIRIRENGCPKYESNSIKIYCENPHEKIWLLENTIQILLDTIEQLFNLKTTVNIDIRKDYKNILEMVISTKKKHSLESLSPEHSKFWNYEKNGSIKPSMVANKTQKSFWWKCNEGHEWSARVCDITRPKKFICPICKKNKKHSNQIY